MKSSYKSMNKVKWLFIALCILPVFCENVEDKESFGGVRPENF